MKTLRGKLLKTAGNPLWGRLFKKTKKAFIIPDIWSLLPKVKLLQIQAAFVYYCVPVLAFWILDSVPVVSFICTSDSFEHKASAKKKSNAVFQCKNVLWSYGSLLPDVFLIRVDIRVYIFKLQNLWYQRCKYNVFPWHCFIEGGKKTLQTGGNYKHSFIVVIGF